jgi:hypothetical protein
MMKSNATHRTGRPFLIVASTLLAIHGIIELLSILWLFSPATIQFAFGELNQSWQATMIVGVISGLLRICAVVGILTNRLWGWALGIAMSIITFAMLTLYLPAGASDAILAGGALVFLLVGRYPTAKILGTEI